MVPTVEGGEGWCYMDSVTSQWESISQMPKEDWEQDFVYIAPDGGLDAVSISRSAESINIRVYRTSMPGHPNIEVEFEGNVDPDLEKCPSMSYKLRPEVILHLSYGAKSLIFSL